MNARAIVACLLLWWHTNTAAAHGPISVHFNRSFDRVRVPRRDSIAAGAATHFSLFRRLRAAGSAAAADVTSSRYSNNTTAGGSSSNIVSNTHTSTNNSSSTRLCPAVNPWLPQILQDLKQWEQGGISQDLIHNCTRRVLSGYYMVIYNNRMYARPLGWENRRGNQVFLQMQRGEPHVWLAMMTPMLCMFPVPNMELVLSMEEEEPTMVKFPSLPIFYWGRNMSEHYGIMFPYYSFTTLWMYVKLGEQGYKLEELSRQGPAWTQRRPTLFWRGSTTGGSPDVRSYGLNRTNWRQLPRVKLVRTCMNEVELCDAKLTALSQVQDWHIRSQVIQLLGPFGTQVDTKEELKYRYLLLIDGNAAPSSRALTYFFTGSAIFKVDSPLQEFWYRTLKPYKHYIPVHANMSNLLAQIRWARANDDQVQQMAKTTLQWARAHLTPRRLLCHMRDVLTRYAHLLDFKVQPPNMTRMQEVVLSPDNLDLMYGEWPDRLRCPHWPHSAVDEWRMGDDADNLNIMEARKYAALQNM